MIFKLKQYIKKNYKRDITLLALFIPTILIIYFSLNNNSVQGGEENYMGGAGDDRAQWVIFDRFDGYQTKADPQKITRGANPIGQNTYINDGDRISIRDLGYKIFPSTDIASTTETQIISIHTFRKRDGTNIMLRSYDDELEYYVNKIARWERLNNGYTVEKEFGFADHNTNVDQTSFVYFGNTAENYSRWTGNVAKLTSAVSLTDTSLSVDSTTLFPSSGSIMLCDNIIGYTAKTATSFTISSATTTCAVGRGVSQRVEEFPSAPKGNIFTVLNTRMFVAGVVSSTQALFYSAIADATDFTFSGTRVANEGGIINMPEGGGAIVGMAIDEQVIYVFKRNIIKSVTFSQDGNDLPTIKPIKPHDNKSQTVGALNKGSIFAGGNGIFFITPNNEIMNLSRVAQVDYPQVLPISDTIKSTVKDMDFSSSAGVFWKNKAYFSAKSSNSVTTNETILVYNTIKKAWESPVIGLNANDWTIAKFGNENDELYFGDSTQPNIYKIISLPLDGDFGVTANWRSREETFGSPQTLKSVDNFFVEGYITDNTTLTISLLLDEDGYTQIYTTDYVGNENNEQFLYSTTEYNMFGLSPFGTKRFGSNADFTGKKKFRLYLNKNLRRVPFYSIQVEFASDGDNEQWEILSYGYRVMQEPQEIKTELFRAF